MSEETRESRVAVVLLNYLTSAVPDTLACIESLVTPGAVRPHIIVVDNGAPEAATAEVQARFPFVQVVRTGRNLGFTGGNNRGIAAALEQGVSYVWILNNDTEVAPDCLERLLEVFEEERDVGAVGGMILYHDDPDRIWFGGGRLSTGRAIGFHSREGEIVAADEGGEIEDVGFLTGCCILASAEALRVVGGFEEDFFAYVEDVDLSLRFRRAGFRLVYQPEARLYHKIARERAAPEPHKIVLRDRNRRRLVRRRYSPAMRLKFMLFFYPSRLAHVLRFALAGDWARLRAQLRGVWER
jgi:GT2 family glycosyltransferase